MLRKNADVSEVAIIFVEIQSIADYELIGDLEANVRDFHWTQPALDGAVSAIRQAVDAAGLLADDEVLISTHGTGTPLNDKNEADAIGVVFGERAQRHPIIATKSAHGHLIGASTALQAVLAIRALEEGLAPPILNYLGRDEEIALDLVLGAARPITARAALVNAFAFGGLNVSLAFRLPE